MVLVAALTHTHPDAWWDTDPALVATMLDVQRELKGGTADG